MRFFKPARDPHVLRGFFSYIVESVIELGNVYSGDLNQDVKIYYDLVDIPGYVKGNMYEVCFNQDTNDYLNNKNKYSNIEFVKKYFERVSPYDNKTWDLEYREYSEKIIKKHFIFKENINQIYSERLSELSLNKTVGVHRRSTDISMHGYDIVSPELIFKEIESVEFDKVFLLCDNIIDLNKFKNRYGNNLITYDEKTTSNNTGNPFHKTYFEDEKLKTLHIQEIVLGSILLSKTDQLICSNSNLSNFTILSNSKLKYKLLN